MPYHGHGHIHHHNQRRTHPLIWCAAIICTFCTVIVIILGIVVFVGYLALHPSIPFVKVTYAHLDKFEYSQAGVLNTEMNIVFQAENDNTGAHASFSDFTYYLNFHGIQIARLKNLPFNVDKNDSAIFNYDVKSYSIPLDPQLSAIVDRSLKQNRISFDLMGYTSRIFKAHDNKFVVLMCSDQSRSSLNPTPDKTTYGTFMDVDPIHEGLSLRILIDHSVVESFGGNGKNVITSRVYPTLAIHHAAYLYAFNYGSESVRITSLTAWSMKKANIA